MAFTLCPYRRFPVQCAVTYHSGPLPRTRQDLEPHLYRLVSLWPLEEENGLATDFERTGVQVMADDPSEIYAGTIKRGKRHYFKAIYADRAVSKACVECHNGHLHSPRQDYKLNDVMGGVIVAFPVK